jgi:glycosyltransferase involved in cell wall biosynthesis
MFSTASGLGEAARQTYRVLSDHGLSPSAFDLAPIFNQSDLGASQLPPPDSLCGTTIILHVNAPETLPALRALGARRWHDCRVIGYWAWELSVPPPSWLPIARHLDEVWTCSDFVRRSFQNHLTCPIRTVPIPISPPAKLFARPEAFDHTPIRILSMADGRSSFHRKNLLSSLRIYLAAFPDPAEATLTLKTRNLSRFPDYAAELEATCQSRPDVRVIDESMTDADRWDLLGSHQIVLSAHRAEGYGLHLAEAMSLGKLVVATGWSGNMQFMTPENSVMLPFKLNKMQDPFGVYPNLEGAEWAEVDEAESAGLLRDAVQQSEQMQRLGAQARSDVANELDGTSIIDAVTDSTT